MRCLTFYLRGFVTASAKYINCVTTLQCLCMLISQLQDSEWTCLLKDMISCFLPWNQARQSSFLSVDHYLIEGYIP